MSTMHGAPTLARMVSEVRMTDVWGDVMYCMSDAWGDVMYRMNDAWGMNGAWGDVMYRMNGV